MKKRRGDGGENGNKSDGFKEAELVGVKVRRNWNRKAMCKRVDCAACGTNS